MRMGLCDGRNHGSWDYWRHNGRRETRRHEPNRLNRRNGRHRNGITSNVSCKGNSYGLNRTWWIHPSGGNLPRLAPANAHLPTGKVKPTWVMSHHHV